MKIRPSRINDSVASKQRANVSLRYQIENASLVVIFGQLLVAGYRANLLTNHVIYS